MTRAVWNGAVIAESDDTVVVDGYHYFPRDSVNIDYLQQSRHTSRCAWKGTASYYTLLVDGKTNRDAAWYYEQPSAAAAAVTDRIAFWRGVKIETTSTERPPKRALMGFRRRPISASRPPSAESVATNVVAELDDTTFESATEGGWTLVDFFAPWCGPCRTFHPVFEQTAVEHNGALRFARCDVDASPRTAAALGILSIPTLALFDPDGNEADRITGVPARRELARLINMAETAVA